MIPPQQLVSLNAQSNVGKNNVCESHYQSQQGHYFQTYIFIASQLLCPYNWQPLDVVHSYESVKYENKNVCNGNVYYSFFVNQLSLFLAVLVVHSVKEDDPEEDEKNDKVDNKKD